MAEQIDLTIMNATHKALRRDLEHLTAAAGRLRSEDARGRQAVGLGWATLRTMLGDHHDGEDRFLWPRMRTAFQRRPDELAVLDAMEEEHQRIDPLIAAIDAVLAKPGADTDALAQAVESFTAEVSHHLTHEEEAALPLIGLAMPNSGWQKVLAEMRGPGLAALKAAPAFFPWLLAEASSADQAAVLGKVPPPVRLLYKKVWLPRYTRQPRWV